MSFPKSTTFGSFLEGHDTKIGSIQQAQIKGSYLYWTKVALTHLDSFSLTITLKSVFIKLFGYVVRYAFNFLSNYTGISMNFMTLEEYKNVALNKNWKETKEKKDKHSVICHFYLDLVQYI